MIIAAEASSTHYAAKLIKFWRSQNKNFDFYGVGSQEMESLGFRRIGKSEEMAVVGIAEIFENFKLIRNVFRSLIAEALKKPPDVVLLMDYPDFNLRLAKKFKALGIKVFYYISPQVWAWRKSRIHDIKAYCEKVFLLFPFEKEFYDRYQVPNEFVGHPLLEDLDPDLFNAEKIKWRRSKYGVLTNEKILALMPGSRKGEVEQHIAIQLQVANKLLQEFPQLRLFVFVAPPLSKEYIQSKLEGFKHSFVLMKDDPNQMIALADYILVASGTATLMVGLLEKPMVIMYKVKWLTGVIGKMLTKGLKYFGLVNLVLDKEVVPERKQEQVTVEELTQLMRQYIVSQEHTQKTIQELKKLRLNLGDVGATARVAKSLEKYLE